ncbi:inactive ubiquitin carboxyl-terminal hydrolase MINDY-4B-like [Haliotis asinina]|uniref:inactive ubiquitin carboxyl-terminal hydrolase MINDY-4B-like n=1 Tax=Haliotis asinina TaxID=109174 RepID=UPI00353276B4
MAETQPPQTDNEKLSKLLRFLEQDSIVFGDNRKKLDSTEKPQLSQRVKTFYVDTWRRESPNTDSQRSLLMPEGAAGRLGAAARNVIGGTPICLQTAIDLRTIVYGSCHHSFSREWQKSSLAFQHLEGRFPYGINAHRCGSRGLTLCVQAFLLKHLLFNKEYQSSIFMSTALQPNSFERRRALIGGMCEMLWQAGERRRCCVCLLQEHNCFGPDYRYRVDNITERLHLFEFKKLEDLQIFIRRHSEQFQGDNSCGCILFLYSLVLSRTVHRVQEDMDVTEDNKFKLLTDMEECTPCLINLLLTGRAVKHLHNGDILYDSRGSLLSRPVRGNKQRSEVGFLFWDKGEREDERTEVGSMLKTPKYPVWLTKINGHFGLLFSTNVDLVSDWRAEHLFALHYYTGLITQEKPVQLTIDTRYNRIRPKTSLLRRDQEDKIPALEQCIMTKWYGANVLWNGTVPFY